MYRNQHRITSFIDLLSRLLGEGANSCYSCGFSVFRGDTDVEYGLVPSVGRNPEVFQREKEIYRDYVRFAAAYGEDISTLSPYDRLASAQHNGVPTRLLDWSLNPLVAAYFATQPLIDGANRVAEPKADAAIYVMHCCERLDPTSNTNPFEADKVRIFHPNDIRSQRIISQQGVFSVQPDPEKEIAQQISEFSSENDLWIDRLIIPKEIIVEIRKCVTFLGISQRTLFPDKVGLGQSLREPSSNGHQYPEDL